MGFNSAVEGTGDCLRNAREARRRAHTSTLVDRATIVAPTSRIGHAAIRKPTNTIAMTVPSKTRLAMTRAFMTSCLGAETRSHDRGIDSEEVANVDEGKRPIRTLRCDPLSGFRRIVMRHTAPGSANAMHGIVKDCRHERYLGEACACRLGYEIGVEDNVAVGSRGVTSRARVTHAEGRAHQ